MPFAVCAKERDTGPPFKRQTMLIKEDYESLIYGKWVSENGTLFEISEDERYGFYMDKNDTSDYYYKGPLTLLAGAEAIEDLEITDEEYIQLFDSYTESEYYIFSLKMHLETLYSEGIDKSDTLYREDYYYFMFMIWGENRDRATVVNMSDNSTYNVSRLE